MVIDHGLEVATELLPFLRVLKNGTVERLYKPQLTPPSLQAETTNGVLSKDTIISLDVSARLYLPNNPTNKLPILVYFHGGGFCIESAFSTFCHEYINIIASQANVIIVSVDYRLAPEHPIPAAYEDSWTALQWVASHFTKEHNEIYEPWLTKHGDFDHLYIGGDSAGANIAHHMCMRAEVEELNNGVKILGAFLSHPYFLGSKSVGSEPLDIATRESTGLYKTWMVVYPNAIDGIDSPWINPFAKSAPCLDGLGCKRLMVCIASEDELRERGFHYYESVKKSGWGGELLLFEVEGEGHTFHVFNTKTENAKKMFKRLARFLQVVPTTLSNCGCIDEAISNVIDEYTK
ncbi:2-hydroxyisoflavanone dehydratase [Artemisia annua]|uniref:2-hydroxyisoflavanone dehydratase n=1 Tax=Artemisia annua TaxID=35608 RepID=A0A2U1PVR7_ARTAN|nr:2-hydroxyisoflavanone dehydratase [Artemisia annua]